MLGNIREVSAGEKSTDISCALGVFCYISTKQERDQQLLKNSVGLALVFRSVMFFSIIFIIVILPSGIIFFALLLACIRKKIYEIEFLPRCEFQDLGQTLFCEGRHTFLLNQDFLIIHFCVE